MTLGTTLALFATMLVGALVPGISVLTVTARAASLGFSHGVYTTLGIVSGDILYILLAIFGLSLLFNSFDGMFTIIRLLGGAYLIWLGITLSRTKPGPAVSGKFIETSRMSSFITGLLITLGDQKAILFYFGLLPAFVDLSAPTAFDTGIILLTALIAVGGAKLFYAALACRARDKLLSTRVVRIINRFAGAVLVSIGLLLLAGPVWQAIQFA